MHARFPAVWIRAALLPISISAATAADLVVTNASEFANALASAQPGDQILLAPGTYGGGHYRYGLSGVTIRSQDPGDSAVIQGGSNCIQLSSPTDVTIEHLIFEDATGNGINIDDNGDWPAGVADNIILRDIVVRNIGPSGNRDAIKLSGVEHFLVDRVTVENWGDGGSAVDPVGCHFGVVRNSLFISTIATVNGSCVRPKGGSKSIRVLGNKIVQPAGRTMQAGGSTGPAFFRFVPADADYEADDITFAGNLVLGGTSAAAYVNIDGGQIRFNYVEAPSNWIIRILNENQGASIVDTQNGVFADNLVVYDNGLSTTVNIGPEVLANTFTFARNTWYNRDTGGPASQAALALPVTEANGVYGVDPAIDPNAAVAFDTPWGVWIVNPNLSAGTHTVPDPNAYRLAMPGASAEFDPLAANPFASGWSFAPLPSGTLNVPARAQVYLANASLAPGCPQPGCDLADLNADCAVDSTDLSKLLTHFGTLSGATRDEGDLDHDGDVDGTDLSLLLTAFGTDCN